MSPTRHTASILAALLLAGAARSQVVDPGDILVASTTATEGQIEKVDPITGETEVVVAYGGVGTRIQDIAVAGDGTIYVAGARSIVSLDPVSGQVTNVASDLPVNEIRRLHIDSDGSLLVLGGRNWPWSGVARVDPATGDAEMAFASQSDACDPGVSFEIPDDFPWFPPPGWVPPDPLPACMPLQNHEMYGQTMDLDGKLFVASRPWSGFTSYPMGVHRVNLSTALVEEIAVSGADLLRQPYDLAVSHTGRLFVADINVEPGNPVCGSPCNRILEIDPSSGAESLVSGDGDLSGGLWELEFDRAGRLLVLNLQGSLVRVDVDTGAQDVLTDTLSWGARGVAIYGMVQFPLSASLSGVAGGSGVPALPAAGVLALAGMLVGAVRLLRRR